MKKFAAFLMILSASVFTVGCSGKTDKTPEKTKTPAGDTDKTPAGDADKTPAGDADKTPAGEAEKTPA